MELPKVAVLRKDITPHYPSLALSLVGVAFIYAEIVLIVIIHAGCWLHQQVFFRIFRIPRFPLDDFLVFDRARLAKLGTMQKLGCAYCSYANAVMAWMKSTINMTEVYSCAIKHSIFKRGQEHQADFHPYEEFR